MEAKRNCAMCPNTFTYETKPGRPPAFCSEECRKRRFITKARLCVICREPFNTDDPGISKSGLYCKKACQEVRGNCAICAKPTSHVFCSHKCLYQEFPLPWPCLNDIHHEHTFRPTQRWLNKSQSLDAPQKFCSQECYERNTRGTNAVSVNVTTARLDYAVLLKPFIENPPTFHLTYLPVRGNGVPFTAIEHEDLFPISKLPITARNTIRFWDYILTSTEILSDLDSVEYVTYLVHYVCATGTEMTMVVPILPASTLWPYIEPYVDPQRYDRRTFENIYRQYQHWMRLMFKQHDAPTRKELAMLLVEAESNASILESHPGFNLPSVSKFRENMRLPLAWLGNQSMIQFKTRRYWRTNGMVQPHEYMLKDQSFSDKLLDVHRKVMTFANKHQRGENRDGYPWGDNCYDAMQMEVEADKFNRRTRYVNFGLYNYPPSGRDALQQDYYKRQREAMAKRIKALKKEKRTKK